MNQNTYDEICGQVNKNWRNLSNPNIDDLKRIGKKLNIDVSIVRDFLGIKDYYDFELDQDGKVEK